MSIESGFYKLVEQYAGIDHTILNFVIKSGYLSNNCGKARMTTTKSHFPSKMAGLVFSNFLTRI